MVSKNPNTHNFQAIILFQVTTTTTTTTTNNNDNNSSGVNCWREIVKIAFLWTLTKLKLSHFEKKNFDLLKCTLIIRVISQICVRRADN